MMMDIVHFFILNTYIYLSRIHHELDLFELPFFFSVYVRSTGLSFRLMEED